MKQHTIEDTTDYKTAERHAWIKDIATRSGIQLVEGNELTDVERRAFTHLTTNTNQVMPVELSNEIIETINSASTVHADATVDTFKHVYEIPVHSAIDAGDAAKTDEGVANEDEQNTFKTIKLEGYEVKKTVKLSRKMAVQSMDGFENWLVREVSTRMGNALDVDDIAALIEGATAQAATALTKAELLKALGTIKTFGNTSKGTVLYASNTTIWNQIAAVEDGSKRSYFVNEKTDDPTVQGRIFGKQVKADDNIADGTIIVADMGLFKANLFDGVDVTPFIENDTQKHCYTGYALYDSKLALATGAVKLTIGAAK